MLNFDDTSSLPSNSILKVNVRYIYKFIDRTLNLKYGRSLQEGWGGGESSGKKSITTSMEARLSYFYYVHNYIVSSNSLLCDCFFSSVAHQTISQ